jgi:uridine phosphorylase
MTGAARRQYHLQCAPGEVGGYVLLPGDPGRVERIAGLLDDASPVASNREFTTWTGTLQGVSVSVVSTGIGGPSAAIAVEELCNLGTHTLLRVGTCGAMQPGMERGDLVVVQAAVRDEGTSHQYMPGQWPATASTDVMEALRAAAQEHAVPCHVGTVLSKDSFYGEMEPERMPVASLLQERWTALVAAGVLASEMECAAVFTVASVRGARSGAVLAVVNTAPTTVMPAPQELPLDALLDVAVAGLAHLVRADQAAGHPPQLRPPSRGAGPYT